MRIEKSVSDCKFIYTKDECGYDEVIEKFKTSKQIYIMTFNISSKKDNLLKELNKVDEKCEVFIITNIPQRYENYFSESARTSARQRINIYMRKLEPKNFESKIIPYFNFNNHSKIILSDENVYVGSANYSDESDENYESGFISYDQEFISFLKKEIFKFTIENSEPYFDNLFVNFKILTLNLYSRLFNLNVMLDENFYEYIERGHSGIEDKVYNTDCFKFGVNEADLEKLTSILYEVEEIINEFKENYICDYENPKQEILEIIERFDKDILDESIELIEMYSDIYNVCSFNYQYECDIFMQEYAMQAYDEGVGRFGEIAAEEVMKKFTKLAEVAEDDIKKLMINIGNILDNIISLLEEISPLSEINRNIDNTNI